MNHETASELKYSIEAFYETVGTHKPLIIILVDDETDKLEMKVFETYRDGETCDSLYHIVKYTELVSDFETNCYVKIGLMRDKKGLVLCYFILIGKDLLNI